MPELRPFFSSCSNTTNSQHSVFTFLCNVLIMELLHDMTKLSHGDATVTGQCQSLTL